MKRHAKVWHSASGRLPDEPETAPEGRMPTPVRLLLRRVESRTLIRDLLNALLAVAAFTGFFLIFFGLIDHRYGFSVKTRLAIATVTLFLAIALLAIKTMRSARKRGPSWAAALIEQRTAALNNQLLTVAECGLGSVFAPAYLRERIEESLSRKLESVSVSRVVPLIPSRAVLLSFFSALAICALIFCLSPQVASDEFRRLVLFDSSEKYNGDSNAASQPVAEPLGEGVEELRVVLTAPAYARRDAVVQIGEGNITALAGTRADFYIKVDRELSAALFSIGGAPAISMRRESELSYHASFVAKEDSNCSISLTGLTEPNWKWEAVYSIRIIKDNPPEVHITRPATDLLFAANARPESLLVDITVKDDYGVALIKLKHIKTTGEGDASRFVSGELNIVPTPADAEAEVRGAARLDLSSIGAEPGTSLVFHAEAIDRNNITGPGIGYSENIIVQVAGTEPVKISLDDIRPDEALKYLTSQRMILIKTERLDRQRAKLPAGDFLSRSQEISVEQRRLRESFNQFSEVESASEHGQSNDSEQPSNDESAMQSEAAMLRAAGVPDIPVSANETAREMILALRAMWKAEGALGTADTGRAVEFEKEALAHLKAAQKGARYFTNVVAQSKPVDLKRRYKGALDEIRSQLERAARKQESPFDRKLRSALAFTVEAARLLAQDKRDISDSSQRINSAREKIDRASDELLRIRGEGASLIVEAASKLKLIARMLGASAGAQQQEAFGLLAQVASEMAAALGRDERRGFAPPPENLPPAASARAAKYFKLLANP